MREEWYLEDTINKQFPHKLTNGRVIGQRSELLTILKKPIPTNLCHRRSLVGSEFRNETL